MGLLEEAIREHLDLQRRRGGDPRQIALAEREALEPLVPGQTPDWAQGPALFDGEHTIAPDGIPAETQSGAYDQPPEPSVAQASAAGAYLPADPSDAAYPSAPVDPAPSAYGGLEQETAELDMRTVLFESPADDEARALEYAAPAVPGATEPIDGPSQPIPEFGGVRARRIVTEPSPPAGGEPDFEWEIPGVARSPRSGA